MTDKISVSFGITKNLGNFESARFDTTYETTIRSEEGEESTEAYERAWAVVDNQISQKLDELSQE